MAGADERNQRAFFPILIEESGKETVIEACAPTETISLRRKGESGDDDCEREFQSKQFYVRVLGIEAICGPGRLPDAEGACFKGTGRRRNLVKSKIVSGNPGNCDRDPAREGIVDERLGSDFMAVGKKREKGTGVGWEAFIQYTYR
jgi:hypothetical protein